MMKNGNVINLYETLQRISENKDLKFSIPVGYLLAKNKEELRKEVMLIHNLRQKILLEHGKVNGNEIIVPKEFVDEVNEKINELMEIESDVHIRQIPIEMLEQYQLNMEDIEGLMGIIYQTEFTGPPIIE